MKDTTLSNWCFLVPTRYVTAVKLSSNGVQGWPCAPAAGITWRIQLRSAFYALHYRATNRTKTIRAQHQLREQIAATTNKVEAYNGFSKWLFFGGEGVIADNDPEEQEKVIKYMIWLLMPWYFKYVVDQTRILRILKKEGFPVNRESVATLSPYVTGHIKRFGDYIIDSNAIPEPIDPTLPI